MKEGILFKIANNDQWVVSYKEQSNDLTPGAVYIYLLHPDSVSDSNVSGTMVKFEVVDGYAKLIK